MKNKLFRRITAVTLILAVLCSIFCSTILAAEKDVESGFEECSAEDLEQIFTKSPFSLKDDQKVTLNVTKAELIAAIKSADVFSVEGTVTEGLKARSIEESFDFSSASKFDAADWAYDAKLISEEEKIDCYCDIIINRNFINEICLNPAFEVIEKYKSGGKIPAELNEKIELATSNPFENGTDDENAARGLFDENVYNSTNFGVHYPKNSGISQQTAINVANYFEQLRTAFANMGFNYPIYQFLITRYQVYLEPGEAPNVDPDTGKKPGAVCAYNGNLTTSASTITIYNLTSFSNNAQEANVRLKELMAHEYFHAIQISYNTFSNWFTEACANWAAIIVTGTSNTVLKSVRDFVGNNPIPSLSNNSYKYGTVVFPLALQLSWGSYDIIRIIYETMNNYSTSITEAQFQSIITEAMEEEFSNDTFEIMYRRMAGFLCNPTYWFDAISNSFSSEAWSDVKVNPNTYTLSSDSHFSDFKLKAERSTYRKFDIPSNYSGSVDVTAIFNSPDGYMQLYFYNSDGSEYIRLPDTVYAGSSRYQATFNIPSYMLQTKEFVIIISNTSSTNELVYSIDIDRN